MRCLPIAQKWNARRATASSRIEKGQTRSLISPYQKEKTKRGYKRGSCAIKNICHLEARAFSVGILLFRLEIRSRIRFRVFGWNSLSLSLQSLNSKQTSVKQFFLLLFNFINIYFKTNTNPQLLVFTHEKKREREKQTYATGRNRICLKPNENYFDFDSLSLDANPYKPTYKFPSSKDDELYNCLDECTTCCLNIVLVVHLQASISINFERFQ